MTKIYRIFLVIVLLLIASCSDTPSLTPVETSQRLLALHGLVGRNASQRPKDVKDTNVSEQELKNLIFFEKNSDQFTNELFTGVVVGALARNQLKLSEEILGKTAIVTAGKMQIHFVNDQSVWKIDIAKTIPAHMKEMAKLEKSRYEAAKSAGQALN